jgi:hypothetical protein
MCGVCKKNGNNPVDNNESSWKKKILKIMASLYRDIMASAPMKVQVEARGCG